MTQPFRANDELELKVFNTLSPKLVEISTSRGDFYDNAYECFVLGDIFFTLKRAPLADSISQDAFRKSFSSLIEMFTRPGTFEFYMQVFRAVWGDDVEVEFTIPSPGILEINIQAVDVERTFFSARKIVDGNYQYNRVLAQGGDYEGNIISFQVREGIKTQEETDALLKELHPAGVIVHTTLVI